MMSLYGCAFAPSQETARFNSSFNMQETVHLMDKMIADCWYREGNRWTEDAIYGVKRKKRDDIIITLGRDNSDIDFMPFARLIISKQQDNVSVVVEEGDVLWRDKWGMDKSVSAWLKGNDECTNPQ